MPGSVGIKRFTIGKITLNKKNKAALPLDLKDFREIEFFPVFNHLTDSPRPRKNKL